jgi:hypothetical protein
MGHREVAGPLHCAAAVGASLATKGRSPAWGACRCQRPRDILPLLHAYIQRELTRGTYRVSSMPSLFMHLSPLSLSPWDTRGAKRECTQSAKRGFHVCVASASHCILCTLCLHRNGNRQEHKRRGMSRRLALCGAVPVRSRARIEREPFWQVAQSGRTPETEGRRRRQKKKHLHFACATSFLMITPGSTPPPALAVPPPWMRASSSSPNPK